MSRPADQHASQVCNTCRIRKKRCDKQLPGCGYCAKRRLACHYSMPLAIQSSSNAVQGSTAWRTRIPETAICRAVASGINASEVALPPQRTSLYDFLCSGKEMALSEVLYNQVSCLIKKTGLSLHEIRDRFFTGFHRWLPIISPQVFCPAIDDIQALGLRSDLSVLLLAICLVTSRPPYDSLQPSTLCLRTLYMTAKISFAQAQAMICASTPLIQAGILIAAYEYASQRPETAFITIGACVKMSEIAGIDRNKVLHNSGQADTDTTPRILEDRNVWWGVIIMERLVLLEMAERNHHSVANFPGDKFPLPLSLSYSQQGVSQTSVAAQSHASLSSILPGSSIDGFGRQAQAISMLDQALHILRFPHSETARLLALTSLDGELQVFLGTIMSEYRILGCHCSANATAIRTLFLIHQTILSQGIEVTSYSNDGQRSNINSWAALDAAARMMASVARHHIEHVADIDIIPICAAYNVRVATRHIAARRAYIGDGSCADLESLAMLEYAFLQRWPAHDSFWN